jgi:2-dehydro-3-deoxygluconokinase
MRYDLLCFGEPLLRLSPKGGERLEHASSYETYVGGSELNVAAGASILGLRAGFMGKVPDSPLGERVRREMLSLRVDDSLLLSDASENARLGLYYYEKGSSPLKPKAVYDRAGSSFENMKASEYLDSALPETKCFHTSGISLAVNEGATVALIKAFKKQGALISFDVNYRAALWSGAEAKRKIVAILPYVDVFFCSASTAKLTFGAEGGPREMLKSLSKGRGFSYVAMTQRTVRSQIDHDFSCVIYDPKGNGFFAGSPYRSIGVVDRIGSGDAFVAGTLYGLLFKGSMKEAARYGDAMAAIKCAVPGDLPSFSKADVDKVISDHERGSRGELER